MTNAFKKCTMFLLGLAVFISILFYQKISPIKKAADHHQQVFEDIINRNSWHSNESLSGTGSTLEQTKIVRQQLPKLIKKYRINLLLDAACGDFNWMKHVDLKCRYIGLDVVPSLIEQNQKTYGGPKIRFRRANISTDALPNADLILCRDCLVHLSYADIKKVISNFKKSGSSYLLTTTFPSHKNSDISTGYFRAINLEAEPFKWAKPLLIINEGCTESNNTYTDKSLALWRVQDIK